jgi:ferricrocin synthase
LLKQLFLPSCKVRFSELISNCYALTKNYLDPSLEALTCALSGAVEEVESESLKSSRQSIQSFRSENRFHILEAIQESEKNVVEILPCTPLQEGLIARFLDSEQALYYNTFTLSINENVDMKKLKAAWETIVKGTDTLRTCFCATPDGYAQIVLKNVPSVWEDVSPSKNVEQVVQDRLQREATSNLHRPPVFIQSIGKTLVLGMFHAIYDGTSVGLLLEDFEKAYFGSYQPRPSQFPRVVDRILAMEKEKAAEFWRSNFKDVTGKALPGNNTKSNSGDIFLRRELSLNLGELENFSRTQGITTLATLQAAWAVVLAEHQGSKVVFGTIVSGRSIAVDGAEEIIGPMFNTLPSVVDISAPSWKDLVAKVHKFNSDAIPFHHTPLRMINKWLRIPQNRPLFDTLFVYQKGDNSEDTSKLWKVEDSKAIADVSNSDSNRFSVSNPI